MVGVQAALSAAFLLALAVIMGAALRRFWDLPRAFTGILDTLRTIQEGPEAAFSLRLKDVEDELERLPRKWTDITREAQAAESRARHHVKRALKSLEEAGYEDAGVAQMAGELQLVDGTGSGPSEVRALPEGVGVDGAEVSDWRAATRMKKFGI